MARAAKACSEPTCPNVQPCPDHQRKPWADSRRNEGRRSGSAEQKLNRFVMLKHQGICHVCGNPGSDEVDHVIPLSEGGAWGMENRKPIHSKPCHERKTQAEARRGHVARSVTPWGATP